MSNLAEYFAKHASKNNIEELEDMGPSVSMAVEAENDEDFKKSTFSLKRTRSMGRLGRHSSSARKALNRKKIDEQLDEQLDEYYDDANGNLYSDADSDYIDEDKLHSASVSPPPADNDNILIPQDDNDVVREPETHVDYLSHQWNESDISNSWKYIILKKKKRDIDLINSARLENASWRTWAKARNHLRTVSPEILNWSKDSDVTWLYGPIVNNNHENAAEGNGNNDDGSNSCIDISRGYGSDDENSKRLSIKKKNTKRTREPPKPILKKRSVTEIIEENAQWKLNEARKHFNEMRHSNVIMDPNSTKDLHDDYDALAAKVNAQYYYRTPQKSNSTTNLNHKYQTIIPPSNNVDIRDTVSDEIPKSIKHDHIMESINNKSLITNGEENNISLPGQSEDFLLDAVQITPPQKYKSSPPSSSIPSLKQNDHELKNLSSILTTSTNTTSNPNRNRHIHFNDRVEQCEALRYPTYNSTEEEFSDYPEDASNDEETITEEADLSSTGPIQNGSTAVAKPKLARIYTGSNSRHSTGFLLNRDDSNDSDSSSGEEEEDDDEEDDEYGGGLFINARYSRKSENGIHSPVTDNSSINSTQSRSVIRPIIKLLPATTLNYGSDEESDSSSFSGYGNAVSHNVNTSRGYDYIYDYNSVYTGDTSSFLPVEHCDIVDVPEGFDLNTSIADDAASSYGFSHATKSNKPEGSKDAGKVNVVKRPRSGFIFDDEEDDDDEEKEDEGNVVNDSSSDDVANEQFIEDSTYHSSDSESESDDEDNAKENQAEQQDEDGLSLRRTVSLGKSTESLKDLAHMFSSTSLEPPKTSFITGQPFQPSPPQHVITATNKIPLLKAKAPNNNSARIRPSIKRNPSSTSFIFDSDSEDDSEEDSSLLNTNKI
ncbi:protein phosphatase regulator REG1 NDAI_0A05800 [Naumovozyma dairenensis CBS 421]|uniref:Nitrogen regulatory protein areA GATA-like domain-containing protein n=1 Tax=Naumovozyma dairenensis (strain ATCC 10597 / BCRC 20456 / CBS 421 / NBRC 0211 / NRRL Y-12639) TaxID=1071378 RepID=G0W4J7_NAUDC|nr:hypothetical protein NDAI_0A05800 [Naumovozyma dairenensis CBS 421]CCD22735.1 hypothetical protein NDAI_0A05800 [Naumovozyma dairenensis CBS 421]